MRRSLVWAAAYLAVQSQLSMADGQLLKDVVFDSRGALAGNEEMVRRLLSPLTGARLHEQVLLKGKPFAGQAINIVDEHFTVYVPSHRPNEGYGLLVFVPPWDDARVPTEWIRSLEEFGIILVSAARSGNDQSVLSRRYPLALLAFDNIERRYSLDLKRVYVGGFSGGARVALRLALGYPDVFSGVILNAGSDPIGTRELPLPPAEYVHQFQDSTRIVYLTGDRDSDVLADDMSSQAELRHWCVFNVYRHTLPLTGHELAGGSAFRQALVDLLEPPKTDTLRLSGCRSSVSQELENRFQHLLELKSKGRVTEASRVLAEIDERFGGIAAPRSVELAGQR